MKMKTALLSIISLSAMGSAGILFAQATFDLNSLDYYGTGPDRAAFVVDWNNGSANEVIAWGYNFDATTPPTMQTMMEDVAADSTSKLFIRWDSDAGFGAFLFGLGLQNGMTLFDVTGAVDNADNPAAANFVNGVWDINTGIGWEPPFAFSGTASNPGDFYSEGFGWSSYVAGNAPDGTTSVSDKRLTSPANWTATSLGISSVDLVDEGWYAFGNGRAPATVPESGTTGLYVAFSAALLLLRRRRKCVEL